ncbi:diacylglycerol/lipid kinase family protein [Fundicoccus sp. Sow4_F4]|uniref:diacylglycerol/lipid kinase family protein n=1 Tax=Fundicoccus sp. Sow4_F4 TaxID=3438783 RepID=UPI003F93F164
MTERVHIICHREAGAGNGKKVLLEVQKELTNFNIDYLTYYTNYATHAYVLTQGIVMRGHKPYSHKLLVIGGDGTLHEVINALHQNQLDIPVTYVAAGTGNDFNRVWQKDKSIRQIVETMLYAREAVRIPIFTYEEAVTDSKGVILNSMGFGFDAEANYAASKVPFGNLLNTLKMGHLNYLLGVFSCLNKIKNFEANLTIDGKEIEIKQCNLLSIMNNPFMGGGIKLDNLVQADKAELSVIAFHNVNLKGVFDLLPRVLMTQTQHESEYSSRYTGQSMQIKLNKAVRGQVDGEDLSLIQADLTLSVSDFPFYL